MYVYMYIGKAFFFVSMCRENLYVTHQEYARKENFNYGSFTRKRGVQKITMD